MDNWQSQIDEIQALSAIYEQDFEILSIQGTSLPPDVAAASSIYELSDIDPPPSHDWLISCKLYIHIDQPNEGICIALPQNTPIQYTETDTSHPSSFHLVKHLPPIELTLVLHDTYPSSEETPPECHIDSMWLSTRQAQRLQQELNRMWCEEYNGTAVVFIWASWLQTNSIAFLQDHLHGKSKEGNGSGSDGCHPWFLLLEHTANSNGNKGNVDDDSKRCKNTSTGSEASSSSSPPSHTVVAPPPSSTTTTTESEIPRDREQVQIAAHTNNDAYQHTSTVEDRLVALMRYSAARDLQLFREGFHTCSICFEEQPGMRFLSLDCSHRSFCRECLSEQARVSVKEGALDALKCPDVDCKQPLSVFVLQSVLSRDLFDRWEELTLQRALDSMSDAAYCPRCGTLSLEDIEENTADCPKCFYVFCVLCNEGRHPGVQCVSAETKLAMLRKKAEGGGAAAVSELRKKEHELLSIAEIEKSSKPCPSCGAAIQRTEGCNKMLCSVCSAYFCYKCGKQIAGYEHFKAGGECVLFDEAEIVRWERRFEQEMGFHAAAHFRHEYVAERVDGGGGGGGGQGGRGGKGSTPSVNCPNCGQLNYLLNRSNHVHCWSCTKHFCASCRMVLNKKGGKHYTVGGPCRQHF